MGKKTGCSPEAGWVGVGVTVGVGVGVLVEVGVAVMAAPGQKPP